MDGWTGRVRLWGGAHPRARRALLGVAAGCFLVAVVGGALHLLFPYPVERLALDRSPTIRDRNGEPLRRMLAPGQVWRLVRPLDRIHPALIEATIAAEDRRFRSHGGVDLFAVARALWLNLSHGRTVSGASTITMQLARMVEPRPRTIWGKLQQAFRALQLERLLTKDEILYQYLNRAPYGGNLSGVEAAARAYFGRPAAELSLAEAALVAGLPQAPSRLRPDRHPDRARARRGYVLDRLLEQGKITDEEHARAVQAPVEVRRRPFEWVARHFTVRFDVDSADSAETDLRTTLDLRIQQVVEDRLAVHVDRLAAAGITNGAAVVIENATGAIRALVGSVRWREPDLALGRSPVEPDDHEVDGTRARRAPGSTLKPLLYAAALDSGTLSPAEVLLDVPVSYRDYVPENMDGECRGPVRLEDALVQSLNLPAVRILAALGPERFLVVLRELGFSTLGSSAARYGLGLALGGCEVTLLDLTHAYSALARGGSLTPLRWRVTDDAPGGGAVGRKPWPVFTPEAAFVITRILQDRTRLGLAADGLRAGPGARVAWKTGTSHGHRDAWCVGYDPQFTVGVWLGNSTGRASAGLVAIEAAAPAMHDVFAAIGARVPEDWPAAPAGLVEGRVCARSGMPPGPHCGPVETAWSIRGRSPENPCRIHRAGGVERWPEDVDAWLRERGWHPTAEASTAGTAIPSPPSASPAPDPLATEGPRLGAPPPRGAAPRILSPRNGERFVLLAGAPEASRLTLRARAAPDAGTLHWFVDGERIATAAPGDPVIWTLTPGTHRLAVVDAHGRSDSVTIAIAP